MAGKLTYRILIEGAETAARKLKSLEGAAQSLGQGGVKIGDFGRFVSNLSPAMARLNPQLSKMKQEMEAIRKAANVPATGLGAFINQSMGIGAGQNTPNKANYLAFFKSALPPVIAPPIIPKAAPTGLFGNTRNFLTVGRGLATAGGFGGGGVGGLFSAAGGAGIGTPIVAAALLGLAAAATAARMALRELSQAVDRGAKLFTDSAKVGRNPSDVARTQRVAEALGISKEEVTNMMLEAQFPQGRSQGGNINRQVLPQGRVKGASNFLGENLGTGGGASSIGLTQQMKNLAGYGREFSDEMTTASDQSGKVARTLFEMKGAIHVMKGEWETMWEQSAALMKPIFDDMVSKLTVAMKLINAQLENLVDIAQFLKLIPKGDNTFNKGLGNLDKPMQGNQFTKMGFVFGNGTNKTNDLLTKIAIYTAQTAAALGAGGAGFIMPKPTHSGNMP